MHYIVRKRYLDRIIGLEGTPDIKIITGVRRSGKSELMKAYIRFLRQNRENANIIYIDFFDLSFEDLKDYHALHEYIKDKYDPEKTNYVFVDEIQLCDKFELAINSLHASRQYDIYLTGSNAFLLSADLATLFTGRYIEIHMLPFSFAEYRLFFSGKKDSHELFDEYFIRGGLAGSYDYKNERDREGYVKEVYTTILTRDLVTRYHISDTGTLEHVAEFLMDNISNLTSPSNISDTLNQNNISTNHKTVGNYIRYLCDAYLFYRVKRYDIRGKKYLKTSVKYYLSDLGFRFSLLGRRNLDYGRVYENIVFLELLRRGYDVYVGKLYKKEIDFVAMNGNEKIYIQVCDDISREETLKRETDPLLKIKDAYPKIIIANTKHEEYDYEGIRIFDLERWLLQNEDAEG